MKRNTRKVVKKINLKNNAYRKKISIFFACLVLLVGVLITSSIIIFSSKEENKTYIAYVYDGEEHDAPPAKDDGYVIDEVKCENAKGAWNNDTWELLLMEMEGNFSCNLRFKLLYPYYKLSINPNGGSYRESPGTYEVYVLERFTYNVGEPTRKGYTFDGWEVTGKNSNITDSTFKMGSENTELKAKWKINTYNVEIMGSDLCDGIRQVDYDTETELCSPTKEGYTFTGWEVTSGRIEGNSFIVDDSDAIITAKWQINNYDYIVYHMQQAINGSYVLKDVDTHSSPYNTEVNPEVRTYTGFTSPTRKTVLITTRDNEVNYRYTRNKYTLTITPGSGVTYSGQTSMQLYFEETTELAIPTKTGYNFSGWSATSGTVTDNIFKMAASNSTLTTNWEPKKFNVTFNGNGGSITQTTKEVTYDAAYGALPSAIRTNYEFLGWYTDPTNGTKVNATDIVKITSNQTLYAHWRLVVFTITFNPNGGSVSPTSTTVNEGAKITNLPTPTRSGYNFGGWYTSLSFTEKITSDTVINRDIGTLYARWFVTPTITISSSQISNNTVRAASNGLASVTWNIKTTSSDNLSYTYKTIDYYSQSDRSTSTTSYSNGSNYSLSKSYSPGRHILIVQSTNQYGDKFYESYYVLVSEYGASSGGLSDIALNTGQTITVEDPGVYGMDGSPLSYISGFTIDIPVISGHSSSNADTFDLYGWNGSSWIHIVDFHTNDSYCSLSLSNNSTTGSWSSHISGSSSGYASSGTFTFAQNKYYKIKFVYYNDHLSCAQRATESASYTVTYKFISSSAGSSGMGNVNMESLFNF